MLMLRRGKEWGRGRKVSSTATQARTSIYIYILNEYACIYTCLLEDASPLSPAVVTSFIAMSDT